MEPLPRDSCNISRPVGHREFTHSRLGNLRRGVLLGSTHRRLPLAHSLGGTDYKYDGSSLRRSPRLTICWQRTCPYLSICLYFALYLGCWSLLNRWYDWQSYPRKRKPPRTLPPHPVPNILNSSCLAVIIESKDILVMNYTLTIEKYTNIFYISFQFLWHSF